MMRELRLTLYFVVGLLLGAVATLANAAVIEEIEASGYEYNRYLASLGFMAGPFEVSKICTGSNDPACVSKISITTQNQQGYSGILNSGQSQFPVSAIKVCPAGYSQGLQGAANAPTHCYKSVAQCPAGKVEHNGVCKTPVCTSTGEASSGYYDMGSATPPPDPPSAACFNGCLAVYSGRSVGFSKLVNGVRRYYAKGAYDFLGGGFADQCSATDAPTSSSTLPDNSCPPGQVVFYVNNNPGCVTKSTGDVTTTPPTKTTTYTTTTNPDGSTTVTKTTYDEGTGQTTTTIITYPPGTVPPVVPGTTTEPSDGDGGTGEGEEGEGDGDKDHCEDDPERVGCKHYDDLVGDVPDPSDVNQSTETVSFNPASGFGSGSYSCPTNQTMNLRIGGQSITVFDWQPMCTFAEGIKPVILAFAFLAAAMIGIGANKE